MLTKLNLRRGKAAGHAASQLCFMFPGLHEGPVSEPLAICAAKTPFARTDIMFNITRLQAVVTTKSERTHML